MSQVEVKTSVGDIILQLYTDKAPQTSSFFLDLVGRGYYDTGDIYRVSQLDVEGGPFLVQGGAALPVLAGSEEARKAPVLDEIETTGMSGILHRRGTLSLARDLNRTGHALAEFFICLGDFPSLDENGRDVYDTQGFPAFGYVLSGLELLDDMATQETDGYTKLPRLKGQMLSSAIKIESVGILES